MDIYVGDPCGTGTIRGGLLNIDIDSCSRLGWFTVDFLLVYECYGEGWESDDDWVYWRFSTSSNLGAGSDSSVAGCKSEASKTSFDMADPWTAQL